jgi:deazaflavin-dependent oxidoreductase (nitroreductase family)
MTMRLQNWFYGGGRPNQAARVLDRLTAAVYGRGVSPDYLVTLEVRGRRSGHTIRLPLVMVVVEGERYLVSMLGQDSNWLRNVRAAGGEAVLRHGRREEVRLIELPVEDRAPVLETYLQRAPNARAHLPLAPDAPRAEIERIASQFPVFRVEPRRAD